MADLSRGLPGQAPLSLIEPPLPDLRHGVVGRNQEALGWLSAWIGRDRPGVHPGGHHDLGPVGGPQAPASLLLWGVTGSGKSFWLEAWASEIPGQRIFDLQNATQTGDLIASIASVQGNCSAESIARNTDGRPSPTAALWLIDNIDAASAEAQQALFALFVLMQQTFGPTRQRLVATAQAAPHQLINRLREDLRTRLSQGLVFELHELDDQEKLQALRERAFRLGWMSAPIASDYDHLFGYMLARLPRQLGRLMRLLEALDARALALKRPVSLPLMRSLLEENLALF